MKKSYHFVFFIVPICISLIAYISCESEDTDKDTKLNAGVVTGTLLDYTGLDGCGFLIKLDNGDIFEPVNLDTLPITIRDGQRIQFTYQPATDIDSYCMAGEVIVVTWVKEIECSPLLNVENYPPDKAYPMDYPHDDFDLDTAYIEDDCIYFLVHYSGGCKEHDFILGIDPLICSSPNYLVLTHNANQDDCEAYLTETLSFDLTSLQQPGLSEIIIPVSIYTDELHFYDYLLYQY